ncbi:M28 family peptidase [Zunongwangia endophytica]|uniref:M28 family peptidase n=1 Tax=Zunongwangia endophytica TaxID=1808945 RepID=A0ABV8H1T1_9FLAO|nr:M28 family peptidase [Zunongwangia endophytica]MDN3596386.1 M20/M25/M40 family metallo-hydrolase [Zunongwangia endophytica]
MRKPIKTLGILAISMAGLFSCKAQGTAEIEISANDMKDNLEYLASDDLLGRKTGTEGIEKAANFITTIFKENGVKPYYDTFRDNFTIGDVKAFNLVGYLEGNDPKLKDEFVVIGAHYDHIGIVNAVDGDSIANGANDNAAGTTAVVELAKYFAELKDNKRSVLFILFSGEEMGLKGSYHSAKRLKEEGIDLYTMINLEMIGVPMSGKDYLAYVTGFKESNLAEKFNEYTGEQTLGFLPEANQMNLFKRSDNYPYYAEFNVPSQTICTFDFTNYSYYHHVKDEVSEMNPEHMANVVEAIIPGIHKVLNTPEKEIKMN